MVHAALLSQCVTPRALSAGVPEKWCARKIPNPHEQGVMISTSSCSISFRLQRQPTALVKLRLQQGMAAWTDMSCTGHCITSSSKPAVTAKPASVWQMSGALPGRVLAPARTVLTHGIAEHGTNQHTAELKAQLGKTLMACAGASWISSSLWLGSTTHPCTQCSILLTNVVAGPSLQDSTACVLCIALCWQQLL